MSVSSPLTRVDAHLGPAGVTYFGTASDDTYIGTNGRDEIFGFGGNDVLSGEGGGDRIFGGTGRDRLIGGDSDDVLQGNSGADEMFGQEGNDFYVVDNTGDVVFEGSEMGRDRVNSFISYRLPDNVEDLLLAGQAPLNGIGNASANVLSGSLGSSNVANRLTGGLGNDRLFGRDGNDTLVGEGGNDLLDGGTGADLMAGGTGNDAYVVDNARDRVIERAGEGRDTVYTGFNEALQANVENAILTGSRDANVAGNDANNIIRGNSGGNVLNGGLGNDRLTGGGGADTLVGAVGKDLLIGGFGADLFLYTNVFESLQGRSRDIIQDFTLDVDLIDLSRIDADTRFSGDQSFTYIGSAGFTGRAGQLRYADRLLQGDVQGDGLADFEVAIANGAALASFDFIL